MKTECSRRRPHQADESEMARLLEQGFVFQKQFLTEVATAEGATPDAILQRLYRKRVAVERVALNARVVLVRLKPA